MGSFITVASNAAIKVSRVSHLSAGVGKYRKLF